MVKKNIQHFVCVYLGLCPGSDCAFSMLISILSSCVYSSVDNVYMCICVNQSVLLCFDVVTSGSWISEY